MPLKIVRIITRLNIGGPAQQVVGLSDPSASPEWSTLLIAGKPSAPEGNMSYLLRGRNIRIRDLQALQRPLHPGRDLQAISSVFKILLREKPKILHTHTAKAGAVGRIAGILYRVLTGKPLSLVHTFHGHALDGYFGQAVSRLFCWIERILAVATDRIIAVSPSVRDDLIARGIAPASKIQVVPLGLPLKNLLEMPPPALTPPLRVGIVGRLAPIKNHAMFIQAIRLLRDSGRGNDFRFWIIGDGEERPALEKSVRQMGLEDRVQFTGWKTDPALIVRELDIVCLTSRNEGTPVSLIEAMAAGRPVISTQVGGVRDLLGIPQWENTLLQRCERGVGLKGFDPSALAEGLLFIRDHLEETGRISDAARGYAGRQFNFERLTLDLTRLYQELVA